MSKATGIKVKSATEKLKFRRIKASIVDAHCRKVLGISLREFIMKEFPGAKLDGEE